VTPSPPFHVDSLQRVLTEGRARRSSRRGLELGDGRKAGAIECHLDGYITYITYGHHVNVGMGRPGYYPKRTFRFTCALKHDDQNARFFYCSRIDTPLLLRDATFQIGGHTDGRQACWVCKSFSPSSAGLHTPHQLTVPLSALAAIRRSSLQVGRHPTPAACESLRPLAPVIRGRRDADDDQGLEETPVLARTEVTSAGTTAYRI